MRDIEFEFIYKGLPFSSTNKNFNWYKKVYTLDDIQNKSIGKLCDIHNTCNLVARRQYTGIKNKSGDKLFEDDIIKIKDGELVHIFYSEPGGGFVGWVQSMREYYGLSFFQGYKNFEIAGNRYQNPELMLEMDNE